MTGEEDSTDAGVRSRVELSVGATSVSIEGSENFIDRQLPELLDWASGNTSAEAPVEQYPEDRENEQGESPDQQRLPVPAESGSEDKGSEESIKESRIRKIARDINVDPDNLEAKFYIDEDGIHIQNPMEIDPEYALLGYCTLRQQMTGEMYHDNRETKQALIDQEKVDISNWGSSFLYQLRRSGLIKDDPNTDRKRNKPFKVTPKGHNRFVSWVNESK